MALPIVEKAVEQLSRKPGESARDAARRAASIGALADKPRNEWKPEGPADLSEARRQAARAAAAGEPNSLNVPKAIREARRKETLAAELNAMTADEINATLAGMGGEQLNAFEYAVAGRRAQLILEAERQEEGE